MGTAVLSPEQAKQIAARKTFSIVPYDTAVAALRECLTFEDVKHWDNYAEVAQAWGKVHKSDAAIRLARAVKLHAQRRMGELATEVAKQHRAASGAPKKGTGGFGAATVLRAQGLSNNEIVVTRELAKMPKAKFDVAAAAKDPLSASSLVANAQRRANPWTAFTYNSQWTRFVSVTNIEDAIDIAKIAKRHASNSNEVKRQAETVRSWLGAFIKAL